MKGSHLAVSAKGLCLPVHRPWIQAPSVMWGFTVLQLTQELPSRREQVLLRLENRLCSPDMLALTRPQLRITSWRGPAFSSEGGLEGAVEGNQGQSSQVKRSWSHPKNPLRRFSSHWEVQSYIQGRLLPRQQSRFGVGGRRPVPSPGSQMRKLQQRGHVRGHTVSKRQGCFSDPGS